MTAVSQKISNLVAGISQQPIEKQAPGTVKDALNVVPDIKGILTKRPGSELIGTLSDEAEGQWHNYYRDENEMYFIRVRKDGQVDVWDAMNGTPRLVQYTETPIDIGDMDNPMASDDAEPICDTCDPDAFQSATNALQDATVALQDQKSKIEKINVQIYSGEYTAPAITLDQLKEQKQQLEQGIPALLAAYTTALAAYETVANNCGIYNNPYSRTLKSVSCDDSTDPHKLNPNLLRYLSREVYEEDVNGVPVVYPNDYEDVALRGKTKPPTKILPYKDIQLTTINDYTFVTNRSKVVNMDEAEGPKDKFEAYFYLNQLAYNQTYTVNYWDADPGNNTEKEIQQATQLELETSTFGGSSACGAATFSEVFTDEGITYRLEVIRNSVLEAEQDKGDDYDCEWRGTVTFIGASLATPSPDVGTVIATRSALDKNWEIKVKSTTTVTTNADKIAEAGPYTTDQVIESSVILQELQKEIRAFSEPAGISKVKINDAGSGYTLGTYTDVALTGGSGSDAKATIVVKGDGTVEKVTITEAGENYKVGDILSATIPGSGSGLKIEIIEVLSLVVEIIGNGLFISSPTRFSIDTTEPQLITIVDNQVNNVAQLPTQCKDGYVVKVVNSFIEEDDYYVKFVANNRVVDPDTGQESQEAASGVWEETFKPGVKTAFDYKTMPHVIRRLPDGTFEVSPIKWGEREVGDNITNPIPSFNGQKINKLMFFRNRFVILAGENVVMSRPNQYFNYWSNTAQTVSDGDPIDLLASSTYPAKLYDGLESVVGLLLFATNQQFIVATDNTDVFSPRTATIKSVGTYKYNKDVRPVHMGQRVGFLNDAGYRSRFFAMEPNRDYDFEALEVSKPVDQLIPSGIDLISDSKDDNMMALSVKGEPDVWVYRYFIQDNRGIQSAWFRWKLSGDILYHCVMEDKFYAVLSVETGNATTPRIVTLQEFDLKLDRQPILIKLAPDMRQYDYQVHMDNYIMVTDSEMTYNSTTKSTSWRLPLGFHGDGDLIVYALELNVPGNEGYVVNGRTAKLEAVGIPNGVQVTAPGNWKGHNVICGFNFDMEVKLPTMYYTRNTGQGQYVADTGSYLNLHRVVVGYDATGMVDTTVKRKGREDYTIKYEASIQDGYIADSSAVEQDVQRTVPIYDKNTNVDIILESSHPTPTNVVSVYWEGDYNPKNYKRV